MGDATALSCLDQLLDLDKQDRATQLGRIATEDPALHARLLQLISAASVTDNSEILAQPVANELRAIQQSATLALEPGQSLAGYRLLRELGRGGMSVVWLAERIDGLVKREVALKLPLFSFSSPTQIARLSREKDALAALSHAHVARLYDAGVTSSGQPFIVLEFVNGVTLTDYCNERKLAIPERLRLFLQVLSAVGHAHQHLIVHRDLKPSNILVDDQGQVKLLDFGIAKLLDEPVSGTMQLTLQGDLALTPRYAAPEQINGQPISTLTDVYVLGVVLYELLTGVLPYADIDGKPGSLAQLLVARTHAEPVAPSCAPLSDDAARARSLQNKNRLRALLAGDLDTMACKAMRLVPAQRYNSVERFADDLRCYLDHLPIAARPRSLTYTARLFLRRHRSASLAAGIGAGISLAAASIALHQYEQSQVHGARAAIVRDFMFDLIEDAEPDESQPGMTITGKQMLDGAVRRARRSFGDQPELQGELLSELGRMYVRLDDRASGKKLLAEGLGLLEQNASRSEPALNKARAQFAQLLLEDNDTTHAEKLAALARKECTQRNKDCAKARAYADSILSRTDLIKGEVEQSLVAAREGVRETALGFGDQDRDVTMALLNLAIFARNAGEIRESGAAMERALAISAKQTLSATDRTELLRTAAVLDLDLGRYESARLRLTQLLSGTRQRGERALQLRLLANVWLAEGEPDAALASADSAIALADREHPGTEELFARQVRAQALALQGRAPEALEEIQAVIGGLRALGRSDHSPQSLRARRIRGEILLRAGQAVEARIELESLAGELSGASQTRPLELGQALDLLGCALRELNRSTEAAALHARARRELEKQLPAGHPFLIRNTLYGEAAAKDRAGFIRDAAQTESGLAPASIWRRLIDAQSDPSACRASGLKPCVLVL